MEQVALAERENQKFSGKRLLVDFLVMVVFPNLFFYLFAFHFSLSRPLVNFDYIIAAFVFLLGFRFFGSLLLLVAFFFDAIFLVGQVLPVFRFTDIFYMLGFVGISSALYQVIFVAAIVLLVVKIAVFMRYSRRGIELSTMFLINGFLIAYVFFLVTTDDGSNRMWRINGIAPIASLTVSNIDLRYDGFVQSFSHDTKPLEPSPYKGLTEGWLHSPDDAPDKIMLIVSESWGVTDPKITDSLLQPIRELSSGVSDFENGLLAFSGVTVEAELRELCGLTSKNFNLGGLESGLEGCLPNELRQNGYRTAGIHGAFGLMYDRANWYPKAGFEETLFFENEDWPRRCYSFPGACDFNIADKIARYYENEDKVFLYWLTLNSHAFYDTRDIEFDVFDCNEHGIPVGSSTCRNLKLHAQFFFRLAEELKSPAFEGVHVAIVGDHEPLILDAEEKARFYKEAVVPWVSFVVGSGAE